MESAAKAEEQPWDGANVLSGSCGGLGKERTEVYSFKNLFIFKACSAEGIFNNFRAVTLIFPTC